MICDDLNWNFTGLAESVKLCIVSLTSGKLETDSGKDESLISSTPS